MAEDGYVSHIKNVCVHTDPSTKSRTNISCHKQVITSKKNLMKKETNLVVVPVDRL